MLASEVVRDRDEIMLQQHDVSGRMEGRLVYLRHSMFSARAYNGFLDDRARR